VACVDFGWNGNTLAFRLVHGTDCRIQGSNAAVRCRFVLAAA
jgi:hypothetical protein